MKDNTVKLIKLLNEGKTSNQIASELNISNKQLYNYLVQLKNKGLFYKRKYYANGETIYVPEYKLDEIDMPNTTESTIITEHKNQTLRCVCMSDIHCGNEQGRLDLVDRVFDYCAKNGISIIFLLGDLIDGTFSMGKQVIEDTYEQVDTFLRDYPFDKNILTFTVLGDHDYSVLENNHQDFREVLQNYRHDIIVHGYYEGTVKLKSDEIKLIHHAKKSQIKDINAPIILHGHSHKFVTRLLNAQTFDITVPSISEINQPIPSILDMTMRFERGLISDVTVKQVVLLNKEYTLSETYANISKFRTPNNKPILNEENFPVIEKEPNQIGEEPKKFLLKEQLDKLGLL